MTLYHVFSEFLDDISEDELPNEATDVYKRQGDMGGMGGMY